MIGVRDQYGSVGTKDVLANAVCGGDYVKRTGTSSIYQAFSFGWNEEKQEKIKNTTVFVAGAGGTGSPTITMLALLGVGCIKICDFDMFEKPSYFKK